MFDFERLRVYQAAQEFEAGIAYFLDTNKAVASSTKDQLHRAAESISLNIAEGTCKPTIKEKQRFYHIARGSTHECVAVLTKLLKQKFISSEIYKKCYSECESISKMLYRLIENARGR